MSFAGVDTVRWVSFQITLRLRGLPEAMPPSGGGQQARVGAGLRPQVSPGVSVMWVAWSASRHHPACSCASSGAIASLGRRSALQVSTAAPEEGLLS